MRVCNVIFVYYSEVEKKLYRFIHVVFAELLRSMDSFASRSACLFDSRTTCVNVMETNFDASSFALSCDSLMLSLLTLYRPFIWLITRRLSPKTARRLRPFA